MWETPLVSVLVPICNVEKYLYECLNSIRLQTLASFEVLCINDGSSDGSPTIIREFVAKDDRFKLIDKKNSGYGDSMNQGLDLARGKYISILESDDFLDSEALEYMVNRCEDENLDVLKCSFWLYWSNPGPERLNRSNKYFSVSSSEMQAMGACRATSMPEIFWAKASIWSAMYKRSFLNDNDIRFLPTPGASFQDTSFSFKVFALAERCAFSARAFLHYRQDNEKSSVNNPGKVFCVCDEHHEISRFLDEDHPELKRELDPIRAKMKFYNYRWNYFRLSRELQGDFLDTFAKEMRQELEQGNVCVCDNEMADYAFSYGEKQEIEELAFDPKMFWVHSHSNGSKSTAIKECMKTGGILFTIKTCLHWIMR